MKTTIISAFIVSTFITSLPAAVINWLDMSPTAVGSSVPSSSSTIYTLPGVGPVTITYNASPFLTNTRQQASFLQTGTVGAGAYTWSAYEGFAAIHPGVNGQLMLAWDITYTFLAGPIAANTLFLGVSGLGQTTSFGGLTTTVDVIQNGFSLGDFNPGMGFGPTLFTNAPGSFHLENSTNGAGGSDPWWNTDLQVVQITDMVSSLTVKVNQIRGDGMQIGLGAVIPEPSTAFLVAATSLLFLRRKR
jgi:hypothetical protein